MHNLHNLLDFDKTGFVGFRGEGATPVGLGPGNSQCVWVKWRGWSSNVTRIVNDLQCHFLFHG